MTSTEQATGWWAAKGLQAPAIGEKREVFCWQCGALVMETFSYHATYVCKICDCSGKLSDAPGRAEFINPGAVATFRAVTGLVTDPYIDFGDPEVSRWHSSPA